MMKKLISRLSRENAAYKYLRLVVQLALLLLVMRQFQIESNAFLRITALAFGGFMIHYFLPDKWKQAFFLLLSLVSVVIVFGPMSSLWLVGIGVALIGLCHAPVAFYGRVILVSIAGILLAAYRADFFHAPWSQAIWPILGSMFMLRIMIYLYDVSNDKAPQSFVQSLSYFFMLPNVCFPMFPLVDYKTFKRTYYDGEAQHIYQTGIDWMTRGVIHLVLYRVVYYYWTIAPAEVATATDFAQLIVSNFLLYLRISGQYHMIIGMLHLFGFRLPETHHLYFLASSLNDHWRRINIYWKDFMMKLFYYPLYFRIRGWGKTLPFVIATLFVFFASWFLHAYQWFWLRGAFLLTVPDMAFWGILAILMVINSLYELKFGRDRSLAQRELTLANVSRRALGVATTFSLICILWSLWQSESFTEWFSLWETVAKISALEIAIIVGGLVLLALFGGIAALNDHPTQSKTARVLSLSNRPIMTFVALVFLGGIGIQEVYGRLGPNIASVINSLRSGKLSRLDVAMLERGYYENLNRVERFNSQLWELYSIRPASWLDVVGSGLERFTGDFRQKELSPSFVSLTSYGKISTNRWGMRDKDYQKIPPPNTFRVALLGASSVMGWGVGDDATFEAIVERRLNGEPAAGAYANFEILNFAVPGYDPLQQLVVLDKAFDFKPNALFYVATAREASRTTWQLSVAVSNGVSLPFPEFENILQKANVSAETPQSVAYRRLRPFRDEILTLTYQRIVEQARARQISPILIFLPQVQEGEWKEETPTILRLARNAGFSVWDLEDVFRGTDSASIKLEEWDLHPNAKGHVLVANRLYNLITSNSQHLFTQRRSLTP